MLYVGHFSFTQPRSDDGKDTLGHFAVIVEADSVEDALEACGERIDAAHESEELFSRGTRILVDGIVEMERVPPGGVLTGFAEATADRLLGSIDCTLPGGHEGVACYGVGDPEGGAEEPFREF
jgi:hypothetical protein